MKHKLILLFVFALSVLMMQGQKHTNEYLRNVLNKVEAIQTASYSINNEVWEPGDTVPHRVYNEFYKEYAYPNDSMIGAKFLKFSADDTTKLNTGYNGEVKAVFYHDHKGIMIDDFKARNLPFRLISPPFFNYTASIIRYLLDTSDSIEVTTQDMADHYYVKLTIHEDEQVEFFGKAYLMPGSSIWGDPTSIFELWINKSNDLPDKYRREMSHGTTVSSCSNLKLNPFTLDDFDMYAYFPEDYEIRDYSEEMKKRASKKASQPSLVGQMAPAWTLTDMNGQPLSSDNLESRVVLINFTGIGCGPCILSVPFLNRLKDQFKTEDLKVIAIESWGNDLHALQLYARNHHINYTFLKGSDSVLKEYRDGNRGVPAYFILDQQRVIRKVIDGYSKDETDKEITDCISELLK